MSTMQTGSTFDSYNTNIWSAMMASGDPYGYGEVLGYWTVPAVTGDGTSAINSAGIWVGLDGVSNWGYTDLIQAGSEGRVTKIMWFFVTSYQAWIEYVPNAEQTVPNMMVLPGDRLWVYVNGYSDRGDFTIYEYDQNWNNIALWRGSVPTPAGVSFHGATAEWVVERPTLGSVTHLANYGSAIIEFAEYYHKDNGEWYGCFDPFRPGNLSYIYMYNSARQLPF